MGLLTIGVTISMLIFRLSLAKQYSCDDNFVKQKVLLDAPNCGNNECLCVGNIARCVGNRTTNKLPKLKPGIDELYIECYGLVILNRSSFANIEHLNLKKIYLRRNEIISISEDIFSKFSNLSVAEISHNTKINCTALYIALGSIQKTSLLNLTFNNIGIRNVTEETFRYLNRSNLNYLSLENNIIELLNMTCLQHLPSLIELRLSGNWISGITGTGHLKNLCILDLSHNHLSQKVNVCLPNGSSLFPNLKILVLTNNRLGTMEQRVSTWNCLNNLEILDLSKNGFKKVDISLISSLSSLKVLRLNSNWIREVIPGEYPRHLDKIDFHSNEITVFPPILCQNGSSVKYPNIRELNFSRNYIQKLITDNWVCLSGIQVLDFSTNDVWELKNNTFAKYTSLTHLYLGNMIPWVKSIEPAAFNSTSLQNLGVRFNMIDFTKPETLQIFKWCPNVKWIDISYNYFWNMTESSIVKILSPMAKLEVIKAQRISLKNFPSTFLTTFKNLSYLDINRNLLHVIRFPDTFTNLSLNLSIRHISVAEGDINTIEKDAFPPSIMNALKELDVSDNEFACTCEMRWFRDEVQNGKIGNIKLLNWPDKYICRSPAKLVGMPFKNYEPGENCEHIKPIFVAFVAVGCSLFVFSVLFATAYWKRWYIHYYWYKISRRRRDAKLTDSETRPILNKIHYDGYVVYNEEDGDFVHHSFRNLMETKLKYKLHIWKRNAKHGTLVDVILDAMYASKQVIVIVSDNLMKDQWCKFQIDVAMERSIELGKRCLMLVVLEDINIKSMSKSWCVLLTKTPTAYWSDAEDENHIKRKFFEEKIKQQFGLPMNDR